MSSSEQRIILEGISWKTYEGLLYANPNSQTPRLTYDCGWLEILGNLVLEREQPNRTLAWIVSVVAEESNVDVRLLGSTTVLRKDLLKGFEPDSAFYIKNAKTMRGKKRLDLSTDPPPDLIIEVDVTSPSLPRFPIFAAVGVPEVWRYDGRRVRVFALVEGRYEAREYSPALPPLTSEILTQFLADSAQMKSTVWLRHVRAWMKERSRT